MSKKKNFKFNNLSFLESSITNDRTFIDYYYRLSQIALNMFSWENLPSSMNQEYLEQTLFYFGKCSLLYSDKYGFINTKCSSNGQVNIYGLPTKFNCYSFDFQEHRKLYTGLKNTTGEKDTEQAILVRNNIDMIPTAQSIELFAYRLYNAERTMDTNIILQKMPFFIACEDSQKLTFQNLFCQIEGNKVVVYGEKNGVDLNSIRSIKTETPFICDKLSDYKKEIWNDFLTFLGINNLQVEKKERLISDEANSNNEVINYNLMARLKYRQIACEQFNELFGTKISVKLNSDLKNIIKQTESIINYNTNNEVIEDE